MRRLSIAISIALFASYATSSMAASVFRLTVQEQEMISNTGLAVLVAEGTLLTSYSLAGSSGQYVVHDDVTGARLVASLVEVDMRNDLALLAAPGIQGEPIILAREPSGEGRQVYLWLAGDERRLGYVHSRTEHRGQLWYRFTPRVRNGEVGAPLMNNCDELLAMSRSPNRFLQEGQLFGLSRGVYVVSQFLTDLGVPFTSAKETCLSVEELLASAKAERARLEEEKAVLEQEAAETEQKNKKRLEEIETEQQALEEQLKTQTEKLEKQQTQLAEKEDLQRQLEEERKEQEEAARQAEEELARKEQKWETTQRMFWLLGISVAIILLVSGVFVWLSLRTRQRRMHESARQLAVAEGELAQAQSTFQDIVLQGRDVDGEEVRVKVNGDALARSASGQVIGRSAAQADYVIDSESVSRRHVRLCVDGEVLTVEDLGSLNGTQLNGRELNEGEPTQLDDGSTLVLGGMSLLVHFLSE